MNSLYDIFNNFSSIFFIFLDILNKNIFFLYIHNIIYKNTSMAIYDMKNISNTYHNMNTILITTYGCCLFSITILIVYIHHHQQSQIV